MVIWLPSFLADTITPSICPSWADDTVPAIATPFWACAPAAFRRVAAATADKRAEILLPDIASSLAGKNWIESVRRIHKAKGAGKRRFTAYFRLLGRVADPPDRVFPSRIVPWRHRVQVLRHRATFGLLPRFYPLLGAPCSSARGEG